MAKSALLQGLKAAARGKPSSSNDDVANTTAQKKVPAKTILVGAHFDPQVRKTLLLVQAKQESNKNLKQLLGEAINDLCVKYGTPEPYTGED